MISNKNNLVSNKVLDLIGSNSFIQSHLKLAEEYKSYFQKKSIDTLLFEKSKLTKSTFKFINEMKMNRDLPILFFIYCTWLIFYANEISEISGIQMTLDLGSDVRFVGIEGQMLNITMDNYNVIKNNLSIMKSIFLAIKTI